MNAIKDVAKQAIVVPFRSENDAELVADVERQLARSANLTITTAEDYEQAADILKGFAAIKKRIGEFFDDDVAAAYKLHKSLTTKRKAALDKVDARDQAIRRAMSGYLQEQERIRQQAEREAQARARKEEEDRIAAEAAALEAAGDRDMAAAVLEQAVEMPLAPVLVPSSVPKVAGVSTVEAWGFEVINPALLPREFLTVTVNTSAIRARVNALKGATKIPGVRVFRDDQVRVRA